MLLVLHASSLDSPAIPCFSQPPPPTLLLPSSVYAYMLEKNRPDLVQKMVAIDVGGGIWWWPSFSLLLIVTYQTYIITAFLIGGSIGNTISRLLSWWAGAPPASNVARASVGYPYWHFWKAQISSCFGLGPFTPQCPVLFMYGTTGFKKFMVSFSTLSSAVNCSFVFGYNFRKL